MLAKKCYILKLSGNNDAWFYLTEKNISYSLYEQKLFFFCTQDTGDIKINELNSGSVEKLKECLFSCCLHAT